jgi:hypothetical protein
MRMMFPEAAGASGAFRLSAVTLLHADLVLVLRDFAPSDRLILAAFSAAAHGAPFPGVPAEFEEMIIKGNFGCGPGGRPHPPGA